MDGSDTPISPTPEDWARLRREHLPEWVKSGSGLRIPNARPIFSSRYQPPQQPVRRKMTPQEEQDYVPLPGGPPANASPCCFYGTTSDFSQPLYADCPPTVIGGIPATVGGPIPLLTLIKYAGPDIVNYSETGDLSGLTQLNYGVFNEWALGDNSYNVCLFAYPYGAGDPTLAVGAIFDNFANTLTLTGGAIIGSQTLTRTVATNTTTPIQGSCLWIGGGYRIDYGRTNVYKYTLTDNVGNQYILTGNQTAPNANGPSNYSPYTAA